MRSRLGYNRAALNPGNSGGPALDTGGKVVGVATLSATHQQAMALCIPASDGASAVARHLAHPDVVVADPEEAGSSGLRASPNEV